MTDDELDALTAPQHYTNQAPPVPGAGLSVSGVDEVGERVTCPNANNPYGHNPECSCRGRS